MQLESSIISEIDRVEKVTNETNPMLRLLLEKLSVKEINSKAMAHLIWGTGQI
jgi:hypothetical protein